MFFIPINVTISYYGLIGFWWNMHFVKIIRIHYTHIKFMNKLFIILQVNYFNTLTYSSQVTQ